MRSGTVSTTPIAGENCGLITFSESHFAGSAPKLDAGRMQPWLTTSFRTAATQDYSAIQITCRACASVATTARPRKNGQIGENLAENLMGDRAKVPPAMGARLSTFRVRARDARDLENQRFSTAPPSKKFWPKGFKTVSAPRRGIFSPRKSLVAAGGRRRPVERLKKQNGGVRVGHRR